MGANSEFIESARFEFERYKKLGDAVLCQVNDLQLYFEPGGGCNSLAVLVKHMAGNMRSRWTDVLNTDGEKPFRNREEEFRNPPETRAALLDLWESGWKSLFLALDTLEDAPRDTTLAIRHEPHSVFQAVHRQLAHYSYHTGQMISLGRLLLGTSWEFQSIPPGMSEAFNKSMREKHQ